MLRASLSLWLKTRNNSATGRIVGSGTRNKCEVSPAHSPGWIPGSDLTPFLDHLWEKTYLLRKDSDFGYCLSPIKRNKYFANWIKRGQYCLWKLETDWNRWANEMWLVVNDVSTIISYENRWYGLVELWQVGKRNVIRFKWRKVIKSQLLVISTLLT